MIIITLVGKVTGKGRPRFSRKSNSVYTPAKTAKVEKTLATLAIQQMNGMAPLDGPIQVQVEAFFTPPKSLSKTKRNNMMGSYVTKKPDADNIAKLMDSLNGIVFHDDSQVAQLLVTKKYAEQEKLVINVTTILNNKPCEMLY